MADPVSAAARERALRAMFDEIDYNGNGSLDMSELGSFLDWATSSPDANEVHRRLALCFLEGGSLEASFAK